MHGLPAVAPTGGGAMLGIKNGRAVQPPVCLAGYALARRFRTAKPNRPEARRSMGAGRGTGVPLRLTQSKLTAPAPSSAASSRSWKSGLPSVSLWGRRQPYTGDQGSRAYDQRNSKYRSADRVIQGPRSRTSGGGGNDRRALNGCHITRHDRP